MHLACSISILLLGIHTSCYMYCSHKWEPHSRRPTCIYIYFSLEIYACSSLTMWFPFIATTKALSVAIIIQQNTDKTQRQRQKKNTYKDIVDKDLPTTIMYTKLPATKKRNKQADKSTDSNTIQSKRIDSEQEHGALTIPSTSNQ